MYLQGCVIKVVGEQGKNNHNDVNGFVFKSNKVVGKVPMKGIF